MLNRTRNVSTALAMPALLVAAATTLYAQEQPPGRTARRQPARARLVQDSPQTDRAVQSDRAAQAEGAGRRAARQDRGGERQRPPAERPGARERMRRSAQDRRAARLDDGADRPGRDAVQRFARRSGLRGDLVPDELDHRPLEEGEPAEMMAFASGVFPEIHQRLEQMERRDPEEFRRQLQRFAPRLRLIQRLQREHPRLARIMLARIENEQRIQRYRRAWDNAPPETRRRILREARERVAENMRLESEVLRLQIERVRETRERRVERWFEHLIKPGADLAEEPPSVRELVEEIHAASHEDRPALEGELRGYITAELDDELAAVEARLQHRDERRAEEVDQRLRRMFKLP